LLVLPEEFRILVCHLEVLVRFSTPRTRKILNLEESRQLKTRTERHN